MKSSATRCPTSATSRLKVDPAAAEEMNGPLRFSTPRRKPGSCAGSIVTELALGFIIVGLCGWLVMEIVGRVRQRYRCEAFVAELRQFEEVFRQFPPHPAAIGAGGALPRATAEALAATRWPRGSPLGGSYEWTPPRAGVPGALGTIAVTAFAPEFPLRVTRTELASIDRELDDGDLATGRFRTGFNGWPLLVLSEKP